VKKTTQGPCQQLSLFEPEPEPVAPTLSEEEKEPLLLDTPERVIDFLLCWAEKHNYPDLEFPIPEPYHDWKTAFIPKGEDKWKFNLANAYSPKWLESAAHIAKYIDETAIQRDWLLAWGAQHGYPGFGFPFHYPPRNEDKDRRFGSVGNGIDGWRRDLCPPYTQRETYEGEFLVKAIEQVKRYDAGEKIPWFEFRLGEIASYSSEEEE
jgi:hypothetical protein